MINFRLLLLCVIGFALFGCHGSKPDELKPQSPISAAISSTDSKTAIAYANVFDAAALEVKAKRITHARQLQEFLHERTKLGRETAAADFNLQWARDIPSEEITDPTATADKITEYANAWRARGK